MSQLSQKMIVTGIIIIGGLITCGGTIISIPIISGYFGPNTLFILSFWFFAIFLILSIFLYYAFFSVSRQPSSRVITGGIHFLRKGVMTIATVGVISLCLTLFLLLFHITIPLENLRDTFSLYFLCTSIPSFLFTYIYISKNEDIKIRILESILLVLIASAIIMTIFFFINPFSSALYF